MKPPAGVFADFKTVKTRSVVQVVIEMPVERGDDVLAALGGLPIPGKEQWVAVALLAPEPKQGRSTGYLESSGPIIKRDWPMASQIHMKCQEPSLWRFLQEHGDFAPYWKQASADGMLGGDIAAEVVRQWCGVQSRREIAPGSNAAERWATLEAEYEQWQRRAA